MECVPAMPCHAMSYADIDRGTMIGAALFGATCAGRPTHPSWNASSETVNVTSPHQDSRACHRIHTYLLGPRTTTTTTCTHERTG
jgi:hypothetical protein